jgi:tetratricopeptide (TPR) repeat protein
MASSSKDADLALLAHGWRLVDLFEKGYLVDAERDRKLHEKLAVRSGELRHRRDAAAWAGAWALLEGRPDAAADHIDEALALGEQARDPGASGAYWLQQHALLLDWGTTEELDGLVDVWRDLVRSHKDTPLWRASLALLLVHAGRTGDAAAELDDLVAQDCADVPLDRDWLPTVAAIGEVAAALGDPRVPVVSKLLTPYAPRFVVVGPALACRGAVSGVLGLLAAASGRWPEVERHFQAAITAHERTNARPLLARARSDFGRALARKRGGKLHVGRVITMLEQAAGEADELGMTRLEAATAAALAQVRAKA